jgi:hypothetical protein
MFSAKTLLKLDTDSTTEYNEDFVKIATFLSLSLQIK